MSVEYGIFNDLTNDEAENLPDYLVFAIGSMWYQKDQAKEKVVEINKYRNQYRSEDHEEPLLIDKLVGRPVNVKLRRRFVAKTNWEEI